MKSITLEEAQEKCGKDLFLAALGAIEKKERARTSGESSVMGRVGSG